MKIAVLGAGAMGQVTVRDLSESLPVKEILVLDLDLARAEQLRGLAPDKIRPAYADVTRVDDLAGSLAGWQTVVNCSPYSFNINVMEAALKAGCHYLDLGGLFHTTCKQMQLDSAFRERDLLAVLGMGAAPGMTNVMAACAADELSEVEAIDIVAASVDLTVSEHPFLPPYALDTILDEYFLEPMIFENQEFRAVPPMSGEVVMEFPEPVGRAASFLTLHSEVATLPLVYKDKGIRRVTYRLGLPAEFHARAKFLVDLGFGEKTPLKVGELEVNPRKVLEALIGKIPVPAQEVEDCEVIRVDVEGRRQGQSVSVRVETTISSDKRRGISAGALDTGVPPSIVAQMICRGSIGRRGVKAPEECVPWREFFDELARRNIVMNRVVTEVLSRAPQAASGKK